jgi:hypothetical protein
MNFDAPTASLSGVADALLAKHFPKLDKASAGVVIVRSSNGGSVLGADGEAAALNAFSRSLNETVWSFEPGKPQIGGLEVDGYTSLVAALGAVGKTEGRQLFISPHEEAAIIMIQASAADSMRYLRFVDHVNVGLAPALAKARATSACPSDAGGAGAVEGGLELELGGGAGGAVGDGSWAPSPPPAPAGNNTSCNPALNATQTGLGMFTKEALAGVEHDLEKMDMVAMPIALAVLAFVLRSWRLMLIPCVCIGTATATSFGVIMLPVSYMTEIISFAPSVMMSCTVAMSIDYSLFLLSRYQEEVVQRGKPLEVRQGASLASKGARASLTCRSHDNSPLCAGCRARHALFSGAHGAGVRRHAYGLLAWLGLLPGLAPLERGARRRVRYLRGDRRQPHADTRAALHLPELLLPPAARRRGEDRRTRAAVLRRRRPRQGGARPGGRWIGDPTARLRRQLTLRGRLGRSGWLGRPRQLGLARERDGAPLLPARPKNRGLPLGHRAGLCGGDRPDRAGVS